MRLKAPYLIFFGEEEDLAYAKTGQGIVHWRPELVAGQLRFPGSQVDMGVPDMTVDEAVSQGVRSLIIGVAPIGGIIPDNWWDVIADAASKGLDIVNGLHLKLKDNPKVVEAASQSNSRLIDIRVPPKNLPVGTGMKRLGKRLLTVGTDCAVGKKYTALALDKSMREAGMNSTFRATGQTGIIIVGAGIPIDAIKADFISGAAEILSPDNTEDHWDVIEGQGTLFHPGYSGVSLGLLHGSQPDAFVVCHDATRKVMSGWEHYQIPSIGECIDMYNQLGQRTNPDISCVGISINTSGLHKDKRQKYLDNLEKETGFPCIDPLMDGCGIIVDNLNEIFN
ncbi:MAG: DUF1611 domain-containing protein [Candidatus Neomarinimicrobiota bacterium]|nr:DUF1611 domain-containing protein [Candidatus Neomarinimicrobiota bacterium]